MHALDGARLKLVRAREHLDHLGREVDQFTTKDPKPYFAEPSEPSKGQIVFTARIREHPNPYWATIVGDFVHNARSALDYVVNELVLVNGGKVTQQTQFPLIELQKDWAKRSASRIAGMSQDAADVIESLQPYHWKGKEPYPLLALRELSNADKHRALRLAFYVPYSMTPQVEIRRGSAQVVLAHMHKGPLEDGTEIARFQIVQDVPGPYEVNVKPGLITLIRVDEKWPIFYFEDILEFVQNQVVEKFNRFFRAREQGLERGTV